MSVFEWAGRNAFRYRSYTPVPFLVLAVLFARPSAAGLLAGFLAMCLGEAMRLWSVSVAGPETRTTRVLAGSELVTEGPYAHTRNPIYIGNMFIYGGVALMSMGLFPWLLIGGMLWFALQYRMIVSFEEEFLERRFGETYRSYRNSVSRFLPRFQGADAKLRVPELRRGFRSDRRTLQAEVAVTMLLVVLYIVRSAGG